LPPRPSFFTRPPAHLPDTCCRRRCLMVSNQAA
jgi:hypothetical protein